MKKQKKQIEGVKTIGNADSCIDTMTHLRNLSPRFFVLANFLMRTFVLVFLLFTIQCSLFTAFSEAAIFDRIVAFVDDQAITLSSLQEQFEATKKLSPNITREEVLNTMINRILLLREAKKYRIEAPTRDQMLNEYIDLKVRAFIRVSEAEIEAFYNQNRDKFPDKTYDDAREEIEKYLTEKELNVRLKETLEELRKKAYIKIQLQPDR